MNNHLSLKKKKTFFAAFAAICMSHSLYPNPALAGMPMISISDVASFRLTTISFFLIVFVLASICIFVIWGKLKKDFTSLPALTFKKSLMIVFICGLAFQLVLVMISGARELMTPGAWEKDGFTSKLKSESHKSSLNLRRYKLVEMKTALWSFAENNNGKFPITKDKLSKSGKFWEALKGSRPYNYKEGLSLGGPLAPLVFEPITYGKERFTLLTNGSIELLPMESITSMITSKEEKK